LSEPGIGRYQTVDKAFSKLPRLSAFLKKSYL